MIDAVLFDLFETLVSQFDSNYQSSAQWLARNLGVEEAVVRPLWRSSLKARETGAFGDFPTYLCSLCRETGAPADEKLIQRLHSERLGKKRRVLMRVEDEVVQALTRLREAGVRLGVVSNCDPEETAAWEDCALASLFDDAVFSHAVGLVKPDPEIFLTACRRLKTAPERCLFVGDGGSDELRAAAGVGMRPLCAVWYLGQYEELASQVALRQRAQGFPMLGDIGDLVSEVGHLRGT
jgi:HAD superfamily hydrolase (TIGR01509 family)